MSHHPKEAQRALKRIKICDDIHFDLFHLLPHKKLGQELAVVSDRFDVLVDTHFLSKKWTLGKLEINSDRISKSNDDGSTEELPFPQKPLPNSVVGFKSVRLLSFDSDAIAFLQRIGRLFQSDIFLKEPFMAERKWDEFATSVWPLLNASALTKISFEFTSTNVHHFRRVTCPSIFRDCSNLRSVSISNQSLGFPPTDADGASDDQSLCQWLHTPRVDGMPKVLRIQWPAADGFPLEALKTSFLNGTSPVNFIIVYVYSDDVRPFELVNSATHEQLKCRRYEQFPDGENVLCHLIVRCPIDQNAKQWAEWEDEAVKIWQNEWNVLDIFNDPLDFEGAPPMAFWKFNTGRNIFEDED